MANRIRMWKGMVSKVEFYLAPMEGITGYIYRGVLHEYYGEGIEKYVTPFLTPHTKCSFNAKEKNDIVPEHNQGRNTVVQVLTNSSQDFLRIAKDLQDFGYHEININLGCPSGTVTSKGRGAGFLREPKQLDSFLEEIFEKAEGKVKVSVKTRIGIEDVEEFYELLEVYNKYPLEELIIHPRVLKEYYNGIPHRDMFRYAMKHSKNSLVYNGDIFSVDDYIGLMAEMKEVSEGADKLHAVMLGRGVLKNPALISQLWQYEQTGQYDAQIDMARVKAFHDALVANYMTTMSGEVNVLYKMKEIWAYMIQLFPNSEKVAKKIRKASRLAEYEAAVNALFHML